MNEILYNFFSRFTDDPTVLILLKNSTYVIGIIILSWLSNLIAKKIIVTILHKIADKTKNTWDDIFVERKVFNKLSRLAPAIVIYLLIPLLIKDWLLFTTIVMGAAKIYMVLVFVWVFDSLFTVVHDIYKEFEIAKKKPIKGYIQVAKIFTWAIALIIVVSILIGKSPAILLGSIGALTAVLMLVFKDTILGFVAGIQLSANDMVRPGDWISMPKYGADGDVIEINLTTVKVRNWDKTITTIPTYHLISDSFKNWRGMRDIGGRRIKRSIKIDLHSIKFLDRDAIDKLEHIELIGKYVKEKQDEIDQYNDEHGVKLGEPNGRIQTNVGVFRKYIEVYLRNNSKIRQDLTFLVRQLEPTETGLPIQIYVFTDTVVWSEYEGIQSDIFDHVIAVIPKFDLKAFQYSTDIYS